MTLSNTAKIVFGTVLGLSIQGCTVNVYEHHANSTPEKQATSNGSTAEKTTSILPPVNIHFNHNQHNHAPLYPFYRRPYYTPYIPRPVIVIPYSRRTHVHTRHCHH